MNTVPEPDPAAPTPAGGASIVFGAVRHARLRPVSNAFCYPAYFLRLPVRRLPAALAGRRWLSHNRWNLLSFHDRDHCGAGVTPQAWIDDQLARAGIDDADGEIWLHTFARVLGYVFNPVSFWYCHRADGALRAVLCEVNNTFGERHCYLLDHADGSALRPGEELSARKVFHVSPFCRVEGRYRFRFVLARGRTLARIDHDDADGPLLTTSVSGTMHALTDAALLRAFFRYPLFTVGVVVRIGWQALRLRLRHVPFHSKPEPPAVEVTR